MVFILYWNLAFFGLSVLLFRNSVYFTDKYTDEHRHTHTHTHTHTTHTHTYCGNIAVCVTVIVMFNVSLL